MNKKLATTLLAGAMSASMVIPAFATTPTTPSTGDVVPSNSGTAVYGGVIIQDKNPVVKVEVPTMFAFVVNGTVQSSDAADSVTSSNGNIILPNVKVDVDTTSTTNSVGGYEYSLTYTGDTNMRINNYSTYYDEVSTGVNARVGLPLKINGEIIEEVGTSSAKKFWEYSTAVTPGARDDFKKYKISIDSHELTTPVTGGGFRLADADVITLAAPDTKYKLDTTTTPGTTLVTYDNLDSSTNLTVTPSTHYAKFDVVVGGQKGQYSQVEESAKIGTIVWTVSADVSTDGVETAPDNNYLAIDPSTDSSGTGTYDTTPTAP